MASTRIESDQSEQLLARDAESTADLHDGAEPTADLPDEALAAPTPTTDRHRSHRSDLLARVPQQRAYGFFVFVACAATAILIENQEPTGSSPPVTAATVASGPFAKATLPPLPKPIVLPVESDPAQSQPVQTVSSKPKSSGAGQARGVLAFDSRSFATSEKAVAAVFIVRRTRDVRGGAVVHWSARSGSADAGIDFSDSSGTVRFADGQQQRAIYVPLRNDLLTEDDETFKVCLRTPRQARIDGASCAEATIRDDDGTSQT